MHPVFLRAYPVYIPLSMCPIPLFTTAVIIFFSLFSMASLILIYAIHVRASTVSGSTSI